MTNARTRHRRQVASTVLGAMRRLAGHGAAVLALLVAAGFMNPSAASAQSNDPTFWARTGNFFGAGNNNFGTYYNGPINIFTNSLQRGIVGANGNVGFGTVSTPRTLMHLGQDCAVTGGGYRPWMNAGTFSCWGSDSLYVGLKQEPGGNDRQDSVVAWGDNAGGPFVGPDYLRFIFTGATAGGGPGAGPNGLEVARFTPAGNVGIGDFVGAAVNPVNRLDVMGSTAIGNAYAGGNAAPNNGLIVQGYTGIGTPAPISELHIKAADTAGNADLVLEDTFGAPGKQWALSAANGNVGFYEVTPGAGRVTIRPGGNVGIGTSNPTNLLHLEPAVISGSGLIRIVDGTQGTGKVLTSNATGIGTWQTPPSVPAPQIVTVAGTTTAGAFVNAGVQASCPAGKTVVGGGYRITPEHNGNFTGPSDVRIVASSPIQLGGAVWNGWEVRGYSGAGQIVPWTLTVYAICG